MWISKHELVIFIIIILHDGRLKGISLSFFDESFGFLLNYIIMFLVLFAAYD